MFAIPMYLLVAKHGCVSLISSCLGGGIAGFLTWISTYLIYTSIWNDDLFNADLSAALGFLVFICLGAVAGVAFWLMHRWHLTLPR
ncbi:hypothetical protein [Burkholderia ambifaria]|uniref:hypothetical protein n=1 Tax=Burkholderia ambifaria TaxID=152480 RepID=UPI001FC882FC|nr:hypothetical protein [Burkholderia ambifaria]